MKTTYYDKVDPEEIIDQLKEIIETLEKRKRLIEYSQENGKERTNSYQA